MAEKVYECMFILNANAYARNPGNASNAIREIVDSVSGEMLASRMYIEQKLAYPVKGQRKGVYWLSYVRLDGDAFTKFNRACQLTDIILRHLIISIDPRLVDTLVAAANETLVDGASSEKDINSRATDNNGSSDENENENEDADSVVESVVAE